MIWIKTKVSAILLFTFMVLYLNYLNVLHLLKKKRFAENKYILKLKRVAYVNFLITIVLFMLYILFILWKFNLFLLKCDSKQLIHTDTCMCKINKDYQWTVISGYIYHLNNFQTSGTCMGSFPHSLVCQCFLFMRLSLTPCLEKLWILELPPLLNCVGYILFCI